MCCFAERRGELCAKHSVGSSSLNMAVQGSSAGGKKEQRVSSEREREKGRSRGGGLAYVCVHQLDKAT